MKIALTAGQPLEEVVRELDRLGYKSNRKPLNTDRFIHTYDGFYGGFFYAINRVKPTALAELKEM